MSRDYREYYSLVKLGIQLENVELFSLECQKFDAVDEEPRLGVHLQRKVNLLSDGRAEVYMKAELEFDGNGPFRLHVEYKGMCRKIDTEIDEETWEQFANVQAVPWLLPYVRECISNTLARMNMPIYYLPTMDILESLKENDDIGELEEMS